MTVVEHSTYELLRTFKLHAETKNCQLTECLVNIKETTCLIFLGFLF